MHAGVGPSMELPMGPHDSCEVYAEIKRVDVHAGGHCHWDLRWSSLRGHDACQRCAKVDVELHLGVATGAFDWSP
eukprot:1639598-Pyramimonas_sp.AAC.1